MNQRHLGFALLLPFVLGGCDVIPFADADCPKSNSPIDCRLDITKDDNNTVAVLRFSNSSKTPYPYLRRNLIQNGELTFDAFNLKENGTPIQYKGTRVKR